MSRAPPKRDQNLDQDGWGADAPPVTRTQLEKVGSAYQPTKVNMRDLTSQKPATSGFGAAQREPESAPGVVRGAYQPIGKVDIAAIRRQAKDSGNPAEDRPTTVKGAYEPVGKVDIAAIRAKAQKPENAPSPAPTPAAADDEAEYQPPSLASRSAAFSAGPERLTSMPKPKVSNKFGGSSTFTGTRAPLPGSFEAKPPPSAAPIGAASRTFADQGGKTPAQIWAEKKARERGVSGSGDALPASGHTGASPVLSQQSGESGWKSGYAGKSWAPIQTTNTGRSRGNSIAQQQTGESPAPVEEEDSGSPAGGIGSIRDRFAGQAPMGAPALAGFDKGADDIDRFVPAAPEPDTSNKPNRGIPIPGLPTRHTEPEEEPEAPSLPTPPAVPRSPTPPTPEAQPASPIRVAQPVSAHAVENAREEQMSPPPTMPVRSLGRAVDQEEEDDDEPDAGPDPGRHAAQSLAVQDMGREAVESAPAPAAAAASDDRARAEYDYEAAEDNEVSLREGKDTTCCGRPRYTDNCKAK